MVYAEPMARAVVEPAVAELLGRFPRGGEFSSTVSLGGDDFSMYAHVRARRTRPGVARVSVACWVVNRDTARYLGGSPPSAAETLLTPEGTADPDEPLTRRVVGCLATRMGAFAAAQPDTDGHFVIEVPVGV
ncbi:hypothetical protein PUR33_27120 [Streptomyces sp. BE282]|uniref:hypothetical protein n=1 Tax=Streptomyces TaxID=1883 RepID=UPI002E79E5CD|nr:hypothetical protein [Streptomyces sp. BE282]MEE1732792.1 hypothetical protein [Streptomyces sp. BE282]